MKQRIVIALGLAALLALGIACGKGDDPPLPTLPERVEQFGGGAERVSCSYAKDWINKRMEQGFRLVAIQGYNRDNRTCVLVWEERGQDVP